MPRFRPLFPLCIFASCLVVTQTKLHAQAYTTASKANDISAFGGYSYANPDFGPTTGNHNSGGIAGVDFTQYLFRRVAPSLEARGTFSSGPYVKEHTFLVGLSFQTDFHQRYHPYADFLTGFGVIKFLNAGPGFHSDRSTVYSYGGGIDIDLVHRVLFKADVQGSHWNLGTVDGRGQTFTPITVSVGAAYRIPFRPHNRQADLQ